MHAHLSGGCFSGGADATLPATLPLSDDCMLRRRSGCTGTEGGRPFRAGLFGIRRNGDVIDDTDLDRIGILVGPTHPLNRDDYLRGKACLRPPLNDIPSKPLLVSRVTGTGVLKNSKQAVRLLFNLEYLNGWHATGGT